MDTLELSTAQAGVAQGKGGGTHRGQEGGCTHLLQQLDGHRALTGNHTRVIGWVHEGCMCSFNNFIYSALPGLVGGLAFYNGSSIALHCSLLDFRRV